MDPGRSLVALVRRPCKGELGGLFLAPIIKLSGGAPYDAAESEQWLGTRWRRATAIRERASE